MKNSRTLGYLFAAASAAAYGTNPIFAKPCYADGMNVDSVLFFRYLFAVIVMLVMMAVGARRHSHTLKETFRMNRHNLSQLVLMGILMALSSITLFASYNFMPVGIASTLLFMYPILVAVIMTLIYGERLSWLVVLCLVIATSGIMLLCPMDEQGFAITETFMIGMLLVILSSLSYAIYLVGLNKSRLRTIASMPVTFYVILFGSSLFVGRLLTVSDLTLPQNGWMWLNLLALGVFPTVVSLVCTALAIQRIGSTQAALLGALEPVTAVILGVLILGESVSLREVAGMFLILSAVTLVVCRRK